MYKSILNYCLFGKYNKNKNGFDENGFITLRCGEKSDWYCDVKSSLLSEESYIIYDHINSLIMSINEDVTQVIGVGYGGAILVSGLTKYDYNGLIGRDNNKQYGMKNTLIGKIYNDEKTVIVEDVLTTGESTNIAVELAKDHNLNIVGIVVVVNRVIPHIRPNIIKKLNRIGIKSVITEQIIKSYI